MPEHLGGGGVLRGLSVPHIVVHFSEGLNCNFDVKFFYFMQVIVFPGDELFVDDARLVGQLLGQVDHLRQGEGPPH